MESLNCFFLVFGWIKLKVGVWGNFRLLILNVNLEMHYQFEILRKCHFSSSRSWFLAQHSTHELVNDVQSFNLENFHIWLPKNDISLVKISWATLSYLAKTLETYYFSAVTFRWRNKINMMMASSKLFVNFWRFLPIVYPYQVSSSSDLK